MPDDEPKTLADKIGAALPIALTAIATAFAGLSSSEMSRAMYWRSVSAQDQAKAASQWNFAGFKRDRAMMAENTAATLKAVAGYRQVADANPTLPPTYVEVVNLWMQAPDRSPPPTNDEAIRAVLRAIQLQEPEKEIVRLAAGVTEAALDRELTEGLKQAKSVDRAWDDELKAAREAARVATLAGASAPDGETTSKLHASALQAVTYDIDARRYRAESTMNFWVGYLYEARVRASVHQSDRHRSRSENFFYAMLAAQVGATVASVALARRTGNVLWVFAAVAGAVAVLFGGYIYLTL